LGGKFLGENLHKVGKVAHFFGHINVAVIDVSDTLSVGDKIAIIGPTTNIEQTVDSMEIEHEKIKQVTAGHSIGMKVKSRVKENDTVYKTD
jgi:translation elongation factor EF-Tu-like GTPase